MWEGVQTPAVSGHAGRQACRSWTKVDQWITNKGLHIFRSSGPRDCFYTTRVHSRHKVDTCGWFSTLSQNSQHLGEVQGQKILTVEAEFWFKPDLILYQKLDFILFIHYDKNMHLPFKLWPCIKTTFQKSFTREKRSLFNHHKAMGKCIVSSTFLWSSFPLNVNLCYNHDSFLLSFSQISISKRLKHLYICALNIIWLA